MFKTNPFRILVALDFSPLAERAFAEAIELAGRHERADLHLVSVVDDERGVLLERRPPYGEMVDQARAALTTFVKDRLPRMGGGLPALAALRPVIHVRVGRIADQIASLAAEVRADLVVVGTHGRRGVERLLLGSVAERLVRIAPVPVLVVRERDFSAIEELPAIDPPCPACVARREATDGEKWWCEDHEQARPEPHVYSHSNRLDPIPPRHHVL